MAVLDAILLSRLDPSELLGLELHFLDAVQAPESRPTLLIYELAGHLISLGRYHLYAGPVERGGIRAWRRLTGGRVVGSGDGWLGVALILPTRSALLREQDRTLKPDQVMNRYVRGVTSGLRALGCDPFYPGRDAITLARREVGMCSFETEAHGALLFEALIAVNRGMEDLVRDLERFDPDGDLRSAMYTRDNSTTLARELGHAVAFAELAETIVRAYAELLGEIERRDLSPTELALAKRRGAALDASGWLNDRELERELNRISVGSSQLGMIEAHLKLRDGAIDRVMITGDFLANSSGLRQFESALAGRPLGLHEVSTAAFSTFGDGSNYILGIGELANLIKLVMKAG